MMKIGIGGLLILLLANCGGTKDSKRQGQVQPAKEVVISQEDPKKVVVPLKDIDLSKIGHITPKGRVQDKYYNELPIVDQLIANGKESIPYLISKLEDETSIKEHVMDYWSLMRVGDKAKWQHVWDENKERIYWDEKDRSFRVRAS